MGIRNDSGSSVYFMRPIGMVGPVKIGCSGRPEARLHYYNQISPFELEMAATLPGDQRLEGRFHAMFDHLRTHHEWFRVDAELGRVIAEVRAGHFNLSRLPVRSSPARSRIASETWAKRRAARAA